MPPEASHSRRTQSLLLIAKLLDSRDNVSPFTLVVDSLEQSATPFIREYLSRAKRSKISTVFISFETLKAPNNVDHLIKAHALTPLALQEELRPLLSKTTTRTLVVFDTLHPLLNHNDTRTGVGLNLSSYLSSLITSTTSLLAVFHSSQPLSLISTQGNPYLPHPLILLKYLATTILTTHSLSHVVAQKTARDRSLAAPAFGLAELEEGTIQGLGANDPRGTVIQCEMRRKSGREVELWFILPGASHVPMTGTDRPKTQHFSNVVLLDDHPLYRRATMNESADVTGNNDMGEVSFNLGLTEKQRRDREEVVLPYFDAQREGGGSEGGRILYDMGIEDDFDEEEDEI